MTGSGGHDEPVPTLRFRVMSTILVGWARLLAPTTTAKGFAPGWLKMMPDAEYSMNGSPGLEGGFSDPASSKQYPESGIGCKRAGFVAAPCRSGHERMSERARDASLTGIVRSP